jgi:mannose-6-phosphate isomerase-like protein (cupin superfamily)
MTDGWHAITRYEPDDFYTQWLRRSEHNDISTANSPVVARGRDARWIETRHDHRIAMLIGEAAGFPTQGTSVCKVIIPVGTHTGKHRHGEEAIHVVAGSGAIVVAGRRYDFHAGTTIHIPYFEEHQLFNTGDEDVELVTAWAMDLDLYARLGRLEQLEDKGVNTPALLAALPAANGQFDEDGRRIALHLEDAPDEQKNREARRAAAKAAAESAGTVLADKHDHGHGHRHEGEGHTHGDDVEPEGGSRAARTSGGRGNHPHRHGAIYILMGGGESPSEERNGFTAVSVAMTNIFEEVPHTSSHLHSHTEAVLYVLEGVGFSEIDFEHWDWEAGDAVHVPPKMTRHEHFNPSEGRTRTLRIEFGIRYFYEPLWKGYWKVEHRETAIARP